jgi:hypothetical protein
MPATCPTERVDFSSRGIRGVADASGRAGPASGRHLGARARRDARHDAGAVRAALRRGRNRNAGIRLPQKPAPPTVHRADISTQRAVRRRRCGTRVPQVSARSRRRPDRVVGHESRRHERGPGGRGAPRCRGRGGAVPDRAWACRGSPAGTARSAAADTRHRRGPVACGPASRPTVRADHRPARSIRDGHRRRSRNRLELHRSGGWSVRQPDRRRRRGRDCGTPAGSMRRCSCAYAIGIT